MREEDRKGDLGSRAAGIFTSAEGVRVEIRDVWASNLEEEMEHIREIIEDYPFVAMDTEFPGVVAKPNGEFGATDLQYQTLRCNVDLLKLIQLGLSFTDGKGNWAKGCTCWQFNFKFSLTEDIFAQDSIDLLKTSGIDFERFEREGIDVHYFGELMMMSGLVLNDEVKWMTFHSSFDFGYLLKTLTCADLPADEAVFMDLLTTYFPCFYDVKYMMTAVEGFYGGLSALADTLQVERIGPMHQAGSDSLLTAQTFFALVKKNMSGNCDDSKFKGELFGIGSNHTKYKNDRGMGNKVVQVLGQGVSVGASGNGTGNSSHHAYSSPNMNSNSGGGHYSGNYQSAQVISPLPVDDSSSHGQPSHSASLDAGY